MDMTRLYNLTTPELRAEAMRLNVAGTSDMTRAQLIEAIRDHARPAAAPKKGFLGRVMGIAKWAASAATDANPSGPGAAHPAPAPPEPPLSPSSPVPEKAAAEPAKATSRTPAGVFGGLAPHRRQSTPPGFEEPFPTRTMARILAEQGHYRRALAIYARLIDEHPGDQELRNEAKQLAGRRMHAP